MAEERRHGENTPRSWDTVGVGASHEMEGAPDTGGPECPFCHGHHGYPDNPCLDMRSADRKARGAYFGGKLETNTDPACGIPQANFERAQAAVRDLKRAAGDLGEAVTGYDYLRTKKAELEVLIALHQLAASLGVPP